MAMTDYDLFAPAVMGAPHPHSRRLRDVHRRARRILSFGAESHTLLGLHVARLEGRAPH